MKRASDNILEKLNGLKKPVFLSKEERQKLAIQRRQEEAAQQKRLQTNNGPPVSSADRDFYGRDREREMGGDREARLEKLREIELKKRKLRFSSNWENTEDTWRDMNSLYHTPHEGFRAGMEQAAETEETRGEADVQKQKEQPAEMNATLHWSEKMLDDMTERDWRMLGLEFNISYKEGSRIPRPMRSWEESRLGPELIKAVDRAGYNAPTPIQMAAIPLGLHQRDFLGIAETCSGQTAAFVLPMLTYITRLPPINELNKSDGPYAVVMAPSIKLVQKIEDETVKFAHYLGIKVASIAGAMSVEEKKFKFGMGCEVVITTPISLFDCLEGGYAVLNQCNYVVLYYADRLIDSVCKPRLVRILDAMPSSNMKPENEDEELDDKKIYRTTCMFSATMPCAVKWLVTKYLRNPVVVNIGTAEKATKLITQHVIMTKESDKMDWLRRFLCELGDKTAFVFVNTSEVGDNVAKNLDKDGYRVARLHEGKSQVFRTKRYNVFVATDVAGRGVDIPDVARVINYDMPGNIEAYARRIGRTGRAGKTGIAITFLTMHDTNIFYDLKQMLISSNSIVPSELARHEASKLRPPRRNDTVFAH